jgi:dihydrofolate synthase/folylpolyglutamate synthase
MDYQQAWTFLNNLQFFKIKLGLDAMATFLGRVGNPQQDLPCIHIAGTNGKGSVGATLLSILTNAGYKAGLYTSPHLSSVRERFRINNSFISKKDFARFSTTIKNVLEGDQITYFEFTTTLALLWFCEQKVDLALMEVGMGGRLDATNIVRPLVSLITNVSMDHEQYLGDTLAEVAAEKAGIIKPGIPVVAGVGDDTPKKIVMKKCCALNSPLYLLGRDFFGQRMEKVHQLSWNYSGMNQQYKELPLAMKGGYQVNNAALAMAALELLGPQGYTISEDHIRAGLAGTRWPGRLEEFWIAGEQVYEKRPGNQEERHFLLDGAHNPAGVQALRRALTEEFNYRRLILIWGAMADKDITSTLATIIPLADHIIFTRPESERSASPEHLLACLPTQTRAQAETGTTVDQALQRARELTTANDLICVAGSLYLVGRARQILRGELVT